MWMRGGTSKGAFFLAEDLPQDTPARDALLLRLMGSPDPMQIDGIGGASPLTSKVAVVQKSERTGVDLDYLFLQVMVDQPVVTDRQNCGNILAAVGAFGIERGLVKAQNGQTMVRVFMENTGQVASAVIPTPDGQVSYQGDTAIDGVPGTHAGIPLTFANAAGTSALLPSGNLKDNIDGVEVTLIDNGMPCVLLKASDFAILGTESPAELEANQELRQRLEHLRAICGPMMNLGQDVSSLSVPKMILLSAPMNGGHISTRTFIPHRCHKSIGVFQAVTVATACALSGTVAAELAQMPTNLAGNVQVNVEQPSGQTAAALRFDEDGAFLEAGIVRTARKLLDGYVF